MNEKILRKWTILIYADGNNEMEDVIYNSILSCCDGEDKEDINLIMEVGLLGRTNLSERDFLAGVKIYNLTYKAPTLLRDLGKANMADPNTLYDFIKFGILNFPAENYMVILSGHGADFIGGMTDLSLDNNYIMGIPEMIKAIGLGAKASKAIIDVLLFDMCFMNSVEIIYEAAQYHNNIKTLMTYTNFAPYDGLDYKELLKIIKLNSNIEDINLYTRNIIQRMNYNLISYMLDNDKLESIKKLFNYLAYKYTLDKPNNNPLELIKNINFTNTLPHIINTINTDLETLVICSKPRFSGINSSITIVHEDIGKLIYFYNKLAFAKDNYWTNLLSNIPLSEKFIESTRVNVRTMNSSTSSIHYLLPLNP